MHLPTCDFNISKLLSKRTYPFQCEAGLVQGPHGDGEGCD